MVMVSQCLVMIACLMVMVKHCLVTFLVPSAMLPRRFRSMQLPQKPNHLMKIVSLNARVLLPPSLRSSLGGSQSDPISKAAKVEVKASKAKAKAKAKASASPAEERRIDPSNGQAYTWSEFRMHYSSIYTKRQAEEYWQGCKVKGAKASPSGDEKRIDPSDKKAYTKEEMRYYYSQVYTKKGFEDHWATCKVVATEKRIDPADNAAYTKEEMASFYHDVFTKQGLDDHWAACKPISSAKVEERRIDPADGKAYTWQEMKLYYGEIYTTKYMEQFWEGCKKSSEAAPKQKGKGKGKGKAPLPPSQKGQPLPKGKGKGKASGSQRIPPPEHLLAPGPQRVRLHHHLTLNCEGTYWQNLSPWEAHSPEVLECTSVDTDELLRQWQIAMAAPAVHAPVWVPRGAINDQSSLRHLQLMVKSRGLTPEIVTRGLTEDFEALNVDQAFTLDCIGRQFFDVWIGQIRAFVQMRGVDALLPEEAVLWAMETSPAGRHMADFAFQYFTLQTEVASVTDKIDKIIGLLQELESSRVLRTLLQTVLIIVNTMSQEEHKAFSLSELSFVTDARLSQRASTLGKLIAENLEVTHMRRERLRFFRMLAVGRVPIANSARRRVWSYLDDLKESPWDVVPLLQRCREFLRLDQFQELLQNDLWDVERLQRNLGRFLRNERQVTDLRRCAARIQEQVQGLTVSADAAQLRLDRFKAELEAAVSHFGALFMGGNRGGNSNARRFEDARGLLRGLVDFGSRLELEMVQIEKRRLAQRGHVANRDGWPVVDTNYYVKHVTMDLDLRRSLHAPPVPRNKLQVAAASKSTEAAAAAVKKSDAKPFAHILHGGQDGEYRRDLETGKWIPIGATAAMVARDRGDRGAVAGFFSTYSNATGHA
mmetsp:Transcript_137428/g.238916  ORF Transcript_137428/g.238916 Transcript_137428/m.238916 type:complete len:877 (+) Transcript_137428:113-2743(+)